MMDCNVSVHEMSVRKVVADWRLKRGSLKDIRKAMWRAELLAEDSEYEDWIEDPSHPEGGRVVMVKSHPEDGLGARGAVTKSAGVVPDAWKVIVDAARPAFPKLVLAEVEDNSKIKTEKLAKLAEMWSYLDDSGWYLEVWVFDRYGQNRTVLNDRYWCDVWLENFHSKPIEQHQNVV